MIESESNKTAIKSSVPAAYNLALICFNLLCLKAQLDTQEETIFKITSMVFRNLNRLYDTLFPALEQIAELNDNKPLPEDIDYLNALLDGIVFHLTECSNQDGIIMPLEQVKSIQARIDRTKQLLNK